MVEQSLVTLRHHPMVDPVLDIWGWEIAVYLFLGGLAAGIMFFSAWAIIAKREKELPFAAHRFALWAPVILSAGIGTLFLDLEYKLHVFRFYTTFQPASPMSWGSWILILVYPVNLLLIFATLRRGYPRLAGYLGGIPLGTVLLDLSERFRRPIAWCNLPLAIALGIYTGILLSAFMARPFWNTGLLGPLFLVSGLSTAAALAVLATKHPGEQHRFTRIDLSLILLELGLIALLLIDLGGGPQVKTEALNQVLGGALTIPFWLFFVTGGLLLPLVLEIRELIGRPSPMLLAPMLVLVGGFVLRQLTLDVGQTSGWGYVETPYNVELLERLSPD